MKSGLEIERKFLIKFPDLRELQAAEKIEITQTYLAGGIRLRRWEKEGSVAFIKTVKRHITDMTRLEEEGEISKEEYEEMLKTEIEGSLTKTRYRLPFDGKLLEIDIFPFWKSQAYLEIELESEDEKFTLPDFFEIIKEVTADKRYRNSALIHSIPKE